MIYENGSQIIGKTPMVKLSKLGKKCGICGNIYAKVEFFNPGGSVKDRVALSMINDAIDKGLVKENTVFIEPTSGNTGIGIAMVATAMGYKSIIVMPDTMSIERRRIIQSYGAELVLTDGKLGMKGAIAKANELHEQMKDSIILGQFVNPANVLAHYQGTGPEIYSDLKGDVDVFVAGVGTGGTITGVGRYLKEHNPNVRIVAVEPKDSPVLSEGRAGPHKIQGIGAGFIPDILDTKIYDEVITVSNEDAIAYGKMFSRVEGLSVGISSGAALKAAVEVASREEYKGKNIADVLEMRVSEALEFFENIPKIKHKLQTMEGVPQATTYPPVSPAPGPISTK